MPSYVNRWTLTSAWIVSMSVVWALFVPTGLSVGAFVLFGIAGLLVLLGGGAVVRDSEPPRSVTQILCELEAVPGTSRPRVEMRRR